MGEPPRRVSAGAVRRRVIRRRVVEFTAAAVAVAVIAVIIPVGIGALGRARGPSGGSYTPNRIFTSRHYGYTEALPAGWRLARQATRQWHGTGGPGYDRPVVDLFAGPRGVQAWAYAAPTKKSLAVLHDSATSGPPAPHIHARRRKPTRPSRSAGHPPGCWACNARQAAVSWWRSRSPSTRQRVRVRIPAPRRGATRARRAAPPSANSWLASGFHRKGSPTRDHATRAPIVTPEAVTTAPISCPYWARNPAKTWPSHQEITMYPRQPTADNEPRGARTHRARQAAPARPPSSANPIKRRQLERSVSWSGRERLRLLWYRLRLTVAEMNYASRRMVELQAPLDSRGPAPMTPQMRSGERWPIREGRSAPRASHHGRRPGGLRVAGHTWPECHAHAIAGRSGQHARRGPHLHLPALRLHRGAAPGLDLQQAGHTAVERQGRPRHRGQRR